MKISQYRATKMAIQSSETATPAQQNRRHALSGGTERPAAKRARLAKARNAWGMKVATTLAAMLMALLASPARASFVEDYNASYLGMQSGMPSNYIDDMVQDSYGFVWICNYGGGLLRYDGYSFQPAIVNGHSPMPVSYSCRNACEDRFKRMWIAFDDGIQVVDLRTRQRTSLSYKGEKLDSVFKQPAVKVYCDLNGNIWIAFRAYIYYINFNADGQIDEMMKRKYSANLPDMVLKDLYHDGSILATIDNGLFRLQPYNGHLEKQPLEPVLHEVGQWFITDIARCAGRTWFATNNGLYSLNEVDKTLQHYTASATHDGHSLSHDFVSSLAVADGETLLVGTLCGVDIMDTRSNTFTLWNTRSEVNPLSSDFVNCIMLLGNQIWVGTETGGIIKLSPRELDLKSFVHSKEEGSISAGCVNAMYIEPNGTLWAGTVDGGLNRMAQGGSQFAHFTTRNSQLTHNSVSTLTADDRNRLWVGTWGGGVCVVDLDHPGDMKRLTVDAAYQRRIEYIGALAYDKRNDGLWIGANEGLYFYDLKRNKIEEPFAGCGDVRGCIGSLIEDNGTLWVGCIEGAVEVNLCKKSEGGGKSNRFVEFKRRRYVLDAPESGVIEKLSCFLQTHDGTLWLGSNEYGLYQRKTDKNGKPIYKKYTMQDGLANNSVKGMVEDNDGMIWIATNNGLSRLNPKTGLFTNYTVDDGLITNQFYWNSVVRSASGVIYLGTTAGLVEFRSYRKVLGEHKGQLRFTRLAVDNQEIAAGGDGMAEDVAIAKEIKIHEWNKSVEVDFSALNFSHEKAGTYSYRLRGFENEWLQLPPGQHSVRYTNLPSGTYTLEVKYSSGDVEARVDTASIKIKVSPYFYKQPWFVVLITLLLGVAVAMAYKRNVERLRRREADMLIQPIMQTLSENDQPMMLRKRILNIIESQNRYKESYMKKARDNDDETLKKAEPFMDKVIRIMEKNYMNSDFGVAELCEEMGMSRVVLSRKLNMETGQPTTKFICSYRLNIARELLLKNDANRNIAEIAFSVGFNDPKYFSRCFTREYGESPNKYMKK